MYKVFKVSKMPKVSNVSKFLELGLSPYQVNLFAFWSLGICAKPRLRKIFSAVDHVTRSLTHSPIYPLTQ